MAVTIRNMEDLEKQTLEKYIASAMKNTQKEIYDCLYKTLVDFYKDYSPAWYERTFRFLKSLISPPVVIKGNVVECRIEVKQEYLDYKYPGNTLYSQPATGRNVAEWAMQGLHGGYIHGKTGSEFWVDKYDLFDKFLNSFRTNLELKGIRVTK